MNNREKDARIELVVFGKVPCNGWKDDNFGSAGGPALTKECNHTNDACYPVQERGSIFGLFGGPRRFTSSMDLTIEMLSHFQKRWPEKMARLTHALETDLHFHATSLLEPDLPEKIADVVLAFAEEPS